ncbi:hypothetical protein H4R19_004670 [Coemansia spiralis]|nr:hypothetical protein H4R19_004670 [Coemansia spiralis]
MMDGAALGRHDPVDQLRRRNQRAVRFLLSISTSSASLKDAGWASRDGTAGSGGSPSGNRQRSAGLWCAEAAVERCPGAPAQQLAGRSSLDEGGRGRAETPQHGRSLSDANEVPPQATADRLDAHGGGGPAATALPAVFASIKPFIGKTDERGHRHGAGSTGDQPPSAGALKKDESFAHLLRPLHTLTPEAEQGIAEADGGASKAGAVDDAELQSGLHRAVAGLTEYVGTILDNVRADDQRQDGGDRTRDAHSDVGAARPTADQTRRLRALMLRIAREQDLELSTAAIGWVYFEKLRAKGYVVKGNRKLVAGRCLLHGACPCAPARAEGAAAWRGQRHALNPEARVVLPRWQPCADPGGSHAPSPATQPAPRRHCAAAAAAGFHVCAPKFAHAAVSTRRTHA